MDAPTDITLHQKSRVLEVEYPDGARYELPLEYLRVYSPSAEVRGHGGPMELVTGKRDVGVDKIEPVGNYAIQLHFDDGHNTGIFSWEELRELGDNYEANWKEYLARLEQAEASRDQTRH
ncbi:hypothetical protein SAOR_14645 [Salinisphaera orenii MK-B5]|uniref:Gamma-butyrobetaine hydroxylase-like N-terminal domain-containing protein n=1 Tax=Salinisphaera orenii MK-B5 TaxID=856730 RepID=A0A423PFR5_9GAMM|nr:DUF971 domain-containing protein [Salinisphaera orenii]ROO24432.1 hypothetical protein SAOR_14645 [Salinisphaera orenii MK-B5]